MAHGGGNGAEWEEEGEEAQKGQELTTSTLPWSVTAGEGRRRRDDARTAAVGAGEERPIPLVRRLPTSITWSSRRRRSRRRFWCLLLPSGWPASTAARQWRRRQELGSRGFRVRVCGDGERREQQGQVGGSLSSSGRQGGRPWRAGRSSTAAWQHSEAPVATGRWRFLKNPPGRFSLFTKRSSSSFSYLN